MRRHPSGGEPSGGPYYREKPGMAEGVGFEPTVGFPTLDFESSALNRTQPPFLEAKENAEPAYAKSFGVASVQRPTSNIECNYLPN